MELHNGFATARAGLQKITSIPLLGLVNGCVRNRSAAVLYNPCSFRLMKYVALGIINKCVFCCSLHFSEVG